MVCRPEDVDDFADGILSEKLPEVEWLGNHEGATKFLAKREYGEYFGNEASTAEFYTKVLYFLALVESLLFSLFF